MTLSASTTTLRIAKVPFLNCAPFYYEMKSGEAMELREFIPRDFAAKTASEDLVAGPMPFVDYLRQRDRFERMGHFGIAVRGRAQSTVLFSQTPIRQMDDHEIAVSPQTSTTVCLLRLILEDRFGLKGVSYTRADREAPRSRLLIGDEALRFQADDRRYPYSFDMGFEWWLWQHLPAVFAVWVVRKDLTDNAKKRIEAQVAKSLAVNTGRLGELAEHYAQTFPFDKETIEQYLSNFVYRFGPNEIEGMQRFESLLERHGWLDWDPA